MKKENIFHIGRVPAINESELIGRIIDSENFIIERIVSSGHVTPENTWYDQNKDEWVMLIQGSATIEFADKTSVEMKAGDYLHIPAHHKHRVTYTSSGPHCIWLAVHFLK